MEGPATDADRKVLVAEQKLSMLNSQMKAGVGVACDSLQWGTAGSVHTCIFLGCSRDWSLFFNSIPVATSEQLELALRVTAIVKLVAWIAQANRLLEWFFFVMTAMACPPSHPRYGARIPL